MKAKLLWNVPLLRKLDIAKETLDFVSVGPDGSGLGGAAGGS